MNHWLFAAWMACQALDGASTEAGLRAGARELNPVLRGHHVPVRVGVNVGGLAAYWKARRNQRAAIAAGFAAAGCAAGGRNLYQLHKGHP